MVLQRINMEIWRKRGERNEKGKVIKFIKYDIHYNINPKRMPSVG